MFVRFVDRLKKIGIDVELAMNFPWVYIVKINGKHVIEKHNSEYRYTIGYCSIKTNRPDIFLNNKDMYKLIRKYLII